MKAVGNRRFQRSLGLLVGLASLDGLTGCGESRGSQSGSGGSSAAAPSGGSVGSGGSAGTSTGGSGGVANGGTSAGMSGASSGGASPIGAGGESVQGGASTSAGGRGGAAAAGGASAGAAVNGGSANAPGGAAGASGSTGKGGSAGAAAVTFETKVLSSDHYAEGADVADVNGDGKLDLVTGPIWYKAPDFAVGGKLLNPVPTFTRDQYSKFFLTYVDDLDGDTYPDVIGIGDAGGGNGSGTPNTYWYKNPGPTQLGSTWVATPLFAGLVSNESPVYANVVGDARKELVFMTNRQLGYATPGATPTAAWTFNSISGSVTFGTPYVHGLGVGDINGDGLADIVERNGWWQQPSSGSGTWQQHVVDFGAGLSGTRSGNWGGAQMVVFDVDGDGDSDVVSALAAHQYGLSWFEQIDAEHFTPHEILPPRAGGTSFSQQHALSVGDVNGDGLPDVVSGKRYYAHPSSNADPGTTDPPVLYWFELSRSAGVGSFIPHLIHSDSGAGCNFTVRDTNGDGKLDIFVSNKRGTFLHTQR